MRIRIARDKMGTVECRNLPVEFGLEQRYFVHRIIICYKTDRYFSQTMEVYLHALLFGYVLRLCPFIETKNYSSDLFLLVAT